MCEHDPEDKLLIVRQTLDSLQLRINTAKHLYQDAPIHPLNSVEFDNALKATIVARDKWLITRSDEDGEDVKAKAYIAIAAIVGPITAEAKRA